MPRPTVFLGPLEISGYYGNLEAGLREIGTAARLVTLHPNPFGFTQSTPNPWPARAAQRWVLRHRVWPTPLRLISGGMFVLSSIALLLWTIPRFSHYVFSWGTTILPRGLDLPILRFLGKTVVVVVGHGSEARPPYMGTQPVGITADRLAAETASVVRRLRHIERWATTVVGLPTTSQFLTRPFVDFYAVGLPTPPAPVVTPSSLSDEIVVLHVPSKPEVKGSALIRAAMDEVLATRPHVRYVELTGRPHDEILSAIASSSLVVDQAWSDIPMAVVGTEAAAQGVATVIGGYAWAEWERLLDDDSRPPTITSAPEDLASTIARAVDDIAGTRQIGTDARAFVTRRWSLAAVATRFESILLGDPDPHWVVDPTDVSYAWGCGVPRERVERLVASLVERGGIRALHWRGAAAAYGIDQAEAEPRT
ncbi:MAG: hypothetical protein KF761_05820 [Salinibacterium sp.]|nr:hypothetical protein [Salinibacterium sp.]